MSRNNPIAHTLYTVSTIPSASLVPIVFETVRQESVWWLKCDTETEGRQAIRSKIHKWGCSITVVGMSCESRVAIGSTPSVRNARRFHGTGREVY